MQVRKRNGELVPYNRMSIIGAMKKAFLSVEGEAHPEELSALASEVEFYLKTDPLEIEEIQDMVEKVLMDSHPEVAKAYILYREKQAELRDVHPDPKAISDYIHASKYARYMPDLQRRETFIETVQRVKFMHIAKFPNLRDEIENAFEFVKNKKILPSMRSMQFAGKAIIEHNARMFNCCFTLIDRPEVFSEILYLLLCGCGVGFSVQKQHIKVLPEIARMNTLLVEHFRIEDSIEGWADAIQCLIRSAIAGYYVEFDYSVIRPEGSPLKTSGGKAPGHLSLKKALEDVRSVLLKAQGRKLKTIECHDIICFISAAVLAGGIRRSSLISLFSKDDSDMLYSKDQNNFAFQGKNWQRALCNNSVVLPPNCSFTEFRNVMDLNRENFGDPGYIFLDDFDSGTNPCGEIGINPVDEGTGFGFCNLVEINLAAIKTLRDFYTVCREAALIATLQASYTDLKYLSKISKIVADRDALIGVGLTGIVDCKFNLLPDILKTGRIIVEETNKIVAEKIGINSAARCTCIKPSGTASLELGCVGSGIHSHHAKRYFRRVTANPFEAPAQFLKKINPQMFEVKPDKDWCIAFPVEAKNFENETAMQMLSRVLKFQQNWVSEGHSVSCTFVVKPDEWDDILYRVWQLQLRNATFLPASSDKDIPYCPREAVITEKDIIDWLALVKEYKTMDYSKLIEDHDTTVKAAACDSEVCEIDTGFTQGEGLYVQQGEVKRWLS